METLSFLALALSAATLVVTILIAIRLKTVHYLLQQPVVKKMSPQLRLKPVKPEEAGRNRDRQAAGGERREGREGRENRRDGREGRENREGREGRADGERREGGRRDGRRDNREGREGRADGERREGGRRDGRRDNREGRPEGERRSSEGRENREPREPREPREARSEGRDNREGRESRPPRESQDTAPRIETQAAEAPRAAHEAPAGLPPRRPLPTFSETPVSRTESGSSASSALSPNEPSEATFVGSGDDVQHGRRTQLKKKPRFDIEEEAPTKPAV